MFEACVLVVIKGIIKVFFYLFFFSNTSKVCLGHFYRRLLKYFAVGIGGPGRLRGSFWFVLGVLSLVLFDNDAAKPTEHPEGQQHHGVKHLLFYLLAWTGLSDHEVHPGLPFIDF